MSNDGQILNLNSAPPNLDDDDSEVISGLASNAEPEVTSGGNTDRVREPVVRARERERRRESVGGGSANSETITTEQGNNDGTRKITEASPRLVANALETDPVVKAEGCFECNICLDTAKEPILTCCGHLYCWQCFYRVPYVLSEARECPVCRGEVKDSGIIPIFGYGKSEISAEIMTDYGEIIPPRPSAQRTESVRQQSHTRTPIQGHQSPFLTPMNRLLQRRPQDLAIAIVPGTIILSNQDSYGSELPGYAGTSAIPQLPHHRAEGIFAEGSQIGTALWILRNAPGIVSINNRDNVVGSTSAQPLNSPRNSYDDVRFSSPSTSRRTRYDNSPAEASTALSRRSTPYSRRNGRQRIPRPPPRRE